MRPFTLFSFVMLLLGFGSWVGVWHLNGEIVKKEAARDERLASISQASTAEASAARMRELLHATKESRAALDSLMTIDLLAAVKTIETAGAPAGVPLHVDSAYIASAPQTKGKGATPSNVRAVGFAVQGSGSYLALMRVIQIFETLPLPLIIESLELTQSDGGDSDKPDATPKFQWHLNLRLRLLTTSNVPI